MTAQERRDKRRITRALHLAAEERGVDPGVADAVLESAERAVPVGAHPRRGSRGVRAHSRDLPDVHIPDRAIHDFQFDSETQGAHPEFGPSLGGLTARDVDVFDEALRRLDRLGQSPQAMGAQAYYVPKTRSTLKTIADKLRAVPAEDPDEVRRKRSERAAALERPGSASRLRPVRDPVLGFVAYNVDRDTGAVYL